MAIPAARSLEVDVIPGERQIVDLVSSLFLSHADGYSRTVRQ
jgi:hypothetical protein